MKVYTKKRENFRINLIFVRISIGFSDKSWYADYQSKKYSSVITAGIGGIKMELEALRKDMVAAMKAKDKVTKEAVSSLISAVKKVAIDEGCRDEIKSDLVDRVILKELKTVKEQLDTCPESREDLKAEYQARYDVIAKYAPKQMDAAEVKAYLEEKFADVIATKNKGQIMKAVMADMKGKADGKVINQVVAELCK